MIRTTGNRLSTRTIGISLLSTTLITTGLVGCASQPIKTSQTPLYQSVLQANQNLVGRQSYAFDYRSNIVSPTLQTNNNASIAKSPKTNGRANRKTATKQVTARSD